MNINNTIRRIENITKKIYFDFHAHSTRSDGLNDPKKLANLYGLASLEYASLADHSTIAGVFKIQRYSKMHGVKVISGIEIICKNRTHILGLGVNIRSTA